MLELAPHISWHYRKYGVQALVAMGKRGDAIKYAMKAAESLGVTDQVKADIVKIVSADNSPGMYVKNILGRHLGL